MTSSEKICVGCIIGAHGIKGSVRVRSFTEFPEDLFTYHPLQSLDGTRQFDLEPQGIMKDHFIAKIDGLTDRTQAESLKGTKLYVSRKDMPTTDERQYYAADLIGLSVLSEETKEKIGVIKDLHDYGAGVFFEIKHNDGAIFMLPFKDAFVPSVDLSNKTITASIPEGWIEEEKPKEPRPEKNRKKAGKKEEEK